MRNNNDPTLNHKRKAKGKKGSNEDDYPLHSIETIVAKNKLSDTATISDRYNIQTLLKNGTDIEAHSVYKKPKSSKSKKSETGNTTTPSTVDSSSNDQKMDEKVEDKPEIKEEEKVQEESIKQEVKDTTPVVLKEEQSTLDAKTESQPEENNQTLAETKKETEIPSEPQTEVKIEKEKKQELPVAEAEADKPVVKTDEETSTLKSISLDKVKNIPFLTDRKPKDIQVSESTPTSPVVKKRKRGRPSRASKSNTTSPLSFSPASSSANSVASSPLSSKIDYSLFGILRSSRRTHHGTFEKVNKKN